MNPYYNPEKLGLDLISFDQPNMCYEYNTLCFWSTPDGKVYTAQDSGCSCPTPFEDHHDKPTLDEVLNTMERVGSLEQAENIFDTWNRDYDGSLYLGHSSRRELVCWITENLKL